MLRMIPAVLIALFLCSPTVAGENAMARALTLAKQGKIEDATEVATKHIADNPTDADGRLFLAKLLVYDGKPDDACATLEAGLKGEAADYKFLMMQAHIYRERGENPNMEQRRGVVSFKVAKKGEGEDDEKAKKAKYLGLAKKSLEKARALRPNDPEPTIQLAGVLQLAGEPDAALEVWAAAVRNAPENGRVIASYADQLKAAGKTAEAMEQYAKALKQDSHLAGAHSALADLLEKTGKADDAKDHRARAAFFEWVPEFLPLDYSPEAVAIKASVQEPREELSKEAQQAAWKKRLEAIKALQGQNTELSTVILAALCFQHNDHGSVEDAIFETLAGRGSQAEPILYLLLDNAQATCTARGASLALAKQKSKGIYDRLIRMLPGDLRAVHYVDVAAAIDELGDARAVPYLIEVLDPSTPAKERAHRFEDMMDKTGARGRAALALGAFNEEKSIKALEEAAKQKALALYCHAALFRLTGDAKYETILKTEIGTRDYYDYIWMKDYVKKMKTGNEAVMALLIAAEKKAEEEFKKKMEKQDREMKEWREKQAK